MASLGEELVDLASRRRAAKMIQKIGQLLKLSQTVVATGQLFMHRFYLYQILKDATSGFKQFPADEWAPAFVYVAAKVDEHPRRISSVLLASLKAGALKPLPDLHAIETTGEDETDRKLEQELALHSQYPALKAALLDAELSILTALAFDLAPPAETGQREHLHPYKYVLDLTATFAEPKELVQAAWIVINDIYRYSLLPIQYRPQSLAIGAMVVGSRAKSLDIAKARTGKEAEASSDLKESFDVSAVISQLQVSFKETREIERIVEIIRTVVYNGKIP